MKAGFFYIVRRSLIFNRKGSIQLALVILVLTAVITGSLMTGSSVRRSLGRTSVEKLGNTGIEVGSGLRYIDPSLPPRLGLITKTPVTGLLEINGSCQNLSSGQSAPGVSILAVDEDFFTFHGNNTTRQGSGEAVINEKLADYLGLKPGDYLVIHFSSISEVPANAPFSPDQGNVQSVALKVSCIIGSEQSGNFSLGISQVYPLNVFVSRADLRDASGNPPKINRILFDFRHGLAVSKVYNDLREVLLPRDIGLDLHRIGKCGCYELTSGRLFIDTQVADDIMKAVPGSFPILTYLCNSFRVKDKMTPYSFVSALPPQLYPQLKDTDGVYINRWLADDLGAAEGDTLEISWYAADEMNHLAVKDTSLVTAGIEPVDGPLADSLLMPMFPGIAGRESCTGWDAGNYVDIRLIRRKDEDYWDRYRGTPKAFVAYGIGRKLWGSNFGPATAIRFMQSISGDQIEEMLRGAIDPENAGFVISDLREESRRAASEGVDFSTLFLGLSFFLVIASVLLLILVVSSYYDARKENVALLYSLGFTTKWIGNFILADSLAVVFTGAIGGAFAGWLFNMLIIKALNSVWQGAVQTGTLSAHFDMMPVLAGSLVTMLIAGIILKVKSGALLRNFYLKKAAEMKRPSLRKNSIFLAGSAILAAACELASFVVSSRPVLFSFCAGVLVFVSLIFLWRHLYLRLPGKSAGQIRTRSQLSSVFYSFSSSQAVTPAVFIAAGLFAMVITGINKLGINESSLGRKGGTGGFNLWGETAIPVKDDLNSAAFRKANGLDDPELEHIKIVQCLRSSGNDASCLNLNHITAPPLLGVVPYEFSSRGAFSFTGNLKAPRAETPWDLLNYPPTGNTIYGIADQTVLEYGLKLKIGDTLRIRSETGQPLNIVISAALRSSVFQGYVLTGRQNLSFFFPSLSGSQVFLADGDTAMTGLYQAALNDRLSPYSARFEPASRRLESFFVVTNTYLAVFSVLGGIGMVLGVIGLGIVLVRNFSQRKKEYAIMTAAGFPLNDIKKMIFREHVKILISGVVTGFFPAILATSRSLDFGSGIPWATILIMVALITATGIVASAIALRSVTRDSLISSIRGC
jgi:putative ABC transport system permease protein